MVRKSGDEALSQVMVTLTRELRKTPEGRELLNNDSNIVQNLAYFVCRDIGLICEYVNPGFGEDWMLGCTQVPRGRGLCLYHYQRKFLRYVFDDSIPTKKVQKYIFDNKEQKKKTRRKRKLKTKN